MDITALRNELANDPAARGYGPLEVSDAFINRAERLINEPARTVDEKFLSASQIAQSIVLSEYSALTAAQRQWLDMIIASGGQVFIGAGSNVRSGILSLFAAGSGTRTNLVAALARTGSRADELGLGTVIGADIAAAVRQGA